MKSPHSPYGHFHRGALSQAYEKSQVCSKRGSVDVRESLNPYESKAYSQSMREHRECLRTSIPRPILQFQMAFHEIRLNLQLVIDISYHFLFKATS